MILQGKELIRHEYNRLFVGQHQYGAVFFLYFVHFYVGDFDCQYDSNDCWAIWWHFIVCFEIV